MYAPLVGPVGLRDGEHGAAGRGCKGQLRESVDVVLVVHLDRCQRFTAGLDNPGNQRLGAHLTMRQISKGARRFAEEIAGWRSSADPAGPASPPWTIGARSRTDRGAIRETYAANLSAAGEPSD
jgi:hypothetical protein